MMDKGARPCQTPGGPVDSSLPSPVTPMPESRILPPCPRRRPPFGASPASAGMTRAVALAVWALATPGLQAQEPLVPVPCAQGRISYVFVDNHSIFDVEDLEEGGSMRWAYELANALHVRTRDGFIRDELLFEAGDCFDPILLEESGRILRSYPFLARADVYAVDQLDGTRHVVVDTQDEWTTQVDLGVSFDGGVRLETLEVTEQNFLGRGILLEGFLRQRKERQDLGATLELPRLFGTRFDAALSGGQTRAGSFFSQSLRYPFVGEVGRVAMRQLYQRRDEIFPYAAGAGEEASHLALPLVDERFELAMAARLGEPGNLTVFGLGVTRALMDYPGFPGDVELIRDGDFGEGEPAPPELQALLERQAHPFSTTRLNFMVGQRNLRFLRIRGLDPLAGEQDVELGTDVGLTVGRSVDAFATSGVPAADDLFARARIFAGADPGTSYVFLNAGAQARQIFAGESGRDGWRDILAEADLYGYIRSRRFPRQTFFARISASGGWRMSVPFQLTLGGRSAVRGWHEDDLPGGRRILATLEDRVFLDWPAPDFMDFGLTAFVDVGRVWPGDVPFGTDSGWRTAVGGGLRLGFPPGSRGVARVDVAFPLTRDNTRGPVLRVSLYELLGLTTGFFDPQMQRSRRVTVGPDAFVQERR